MIEPAEVYDPDTGHWTATGGMIEARANHAATLLRDGRVLAAGGRGNRAANYGLLATAELYDPESGRWHATERMAEARDGHTATLLPDGTVLVAGDYNHASLRRTVRPRQWDLTCRDQPAVDVLGAALRRS